MRLLGLIMAAFGGGATLFNLAMGSGHAYSALPLLVWGAVCVVGIVLVVTHPKENKSDK